MLLERRIRRTRIYNKINKTLAFNIFNMDTKVHVINELYSRDAFVLVIIYATQHFLVFFFFFGWTEIRYWFSETINFVERGNHKRTTFNSSADVVNDYYAIHYTLTHFIKEYFQNIWWTIGYSEQQQNLVVESITHYWAIEYLFWVNRLEMFEWKELTTKEYGKGVYSSYRHTFTRILWVMGHLFKGQRCKN